MIHDALFTAIGLLCVAIAIAIAFVPRGRHDAASFTRELETYGPTLAPLPAADEPWQPRACGDIPPATPAVSVALSATRHHCYQYAARLAAMSWQSHHTLQRSYDMLAFATVASSYYRMGGNYVG